MMGMSHSSSMETEVEEVSEKSELKICMQSIGSFMISSHKRSAGHMNSKDFWE